MGDLADAGRTVAHANGDFRIVAAEAVAQAEQRSAAVGEAADRSGEIARQIVVLLPGGGAAGELHEERLVYRFEQAASALAPIEQAAVAQRSDQPGVWRDDLRPLGDEEHKCVLQQVLGILRRDTEIGEEASEFRLQPVHQLGEFVLDAARIECAHSGLGYAKSDGKCSTA